MRWVHFHTADTIPISRQRISVFPKFFHGVDFFPAGCAILGGRHNESINGSYRPAPTILICTFRTPVYIYVQDICVYVDFWMRGISASAEKLDCHLASASHAAIGWISMAHLSLSQSGMLINYEIPLLTSGKIFWRF